MALKMKENFQKVISGSRQIGSVPSNVYINRAGRPVALNTTPVLPVNNSSIKDCSNDKLNDGEDIESVKGKQL